MKFDLKKNFENRKINENITNEKWNDLMKIFDYSNQSMTKEEIKKWVDCSSPTFRTEELSQNEMFEDFEQIKFLIKNLYIGYKIFGEDFFEKSFSKIEKFIHSHTVLTPEEFCQAIADSFSGIKDAHFSIRADNQHWHRPAELTKERTYYNITNLIEKEKDEFYLNGHKIILINGKEPQNFIRTVCTPKGDLKLGFVARLENKQRTAKISCLMENGKTIDLLVTKKDFEVNQTSDSFGIIKKEDNCLYVKVETCSNHSTQLKENFKKFLQNIDELNKNIDYYIIDVRGNTGGSDMVSVDITNKLLGTKDYSYQLKYIDLCSRFPYETEKDDNKTYQNSIWKEYQTSLKNGQPFIKRIIEKERKNTENNGKPIFVLSDGNTASAGEAFSIYYNNFPNIIFLNDNTEGCVHFGNVTSYSLNQSKLRLNFGNSFFLHDNSFIEQKGVVPDIYFACQNKDVLTTLKKFIAKNIKTKNNFKEK